MHFTFWHFEHGKISVGHEGTYMIHVIKKEELLSAGHCYYNNVIQIALQSLSHGEALLCNSVNILDCLLT